MKKKLVLVILCGLLESSYTIKSQSLQNNSFEDTIILQKQFDSVFKQRGGRLIKLSPQLEELRYFILAFGNQDIYSIRQTQPEFPSAYFDIINDSSINAFSTSYRHKYFIGISLGALIILEDAFLRMLSYKNVMPDIGDTSKEINPPKINEMQIDNIRQFVGNRINESTPIEPKDSTRRLLSAILMKLVTIFIVNHEYGHILRGHVRYIRSMGISEPLDEVSGLNFTDKNDSILLKQDMEVDADYMATLFGMYYGRRAIDNINGVNKLSRIFFRDWKIYLRLWMFSAYTFYKIIGNRNVPTNFSFNTGYPPPSVRNYLVEVSAVNVLHYNLRIKITDNDIYEICGSTLNEVDRAFSEATYLNYDLYEMKYVQDSATKKHIGIIMNNSHKYYSVMRKFAYMPLPN